MQLLDMVCIGVVAVEGEHCTAIAKIHAQTEFPAIFFFFFFFFFFLFFVRNLFL
jgi:hypothetical protein